jgi:zinc protease
VTAPEVLPALEAAFGAWPKGPHVPLEAPPPPPNQQTGPRVVLVDNPGSTQSIVYAVGPALPWSDPRRDAFRLMNAILGGFWMSRLNADLREARGLTYWVSSGVRAYRGAGPFLAGGGIVVERTGEAIPELLRDVRAMTESEVSDEELQGARRFLVNLVYSRFETDAGLAAGLGDLAAFGLSPDDYATLPARVERLTAAELLEAARAFLHPDSMKVIVVADRAKVEPQVRSLGLGEIEARTGCGGP